MTQQTPTPSILWRLAADALQVFYSRSAHRHGESMPGVTLVTSGEPVADLNYLMVGGDDPQAQDGLRACVEWCDARDLPFLVMVTPEAAEGLAALRDQLGLAWVADWPVMACPAVQHGTPIAAHPAEGVTVRHVVNAADHDGLVDVLAGAYDMPAESVARAMPLDLFDSPSIEGWIGILDGDCLSSVTATWHGDVVGIWAMGTLPAAQRRGVGRALLSTVMSDCHARGARQFFLGATPAGYKLYEGLGYRTVFEARIWVRGETNQA
jgi:ribosomal protein S18 acetylase RimI-like enzyme